MSYKTFSLYDSAPDHIDMKVIYIIRLLDNSITLKTCNNKNTIFKVLRTQLELGQVTQEIDRKIAEKEEEFDNTR